MSETEHTESHPQRYPHHPDAAKGQVYGGECNRTACTSRGATWWNLGTYGLYCPECARAINWQGRQPALCIHVEAKPLVRDMEQLKRDKGYYDIQYA